MDRKAVPAPLAFQPLLPLEAALMQAEYLPGYTGISVGIADPSTGAYVRPATATVSNTVRGEFLSWLLAIADLSGTAQEFGIGLAGAAITGELALSFCQLDVPVTLVKCLIEHVDIRYANLLAFGTLECVVDRLEADGMQVRADLLLSGTEITDANLTGCTISGDLTAVNCTIGGKSGSALRLARSKIGGSLYFHDANIKGGIDLQSSTVGGSIELTNAQVTAHGVAIRLSRAEVKGSVLLNGTFKSKGIVETAHASIGGTFFCHMGTFEGEQLETGDVHTSIAGLGVRIDGDVVFDSATIAGIALLSRAQIGGSVEFDQVTLVADTINGLDLDSAHIEGTFNYHRTPANEKTVMRLLGTRIGRLDDDTESWPQAGRIMMHGCRYETIGTGRIDTARRLEWIGRQPSGKYSLEPYEYLATLLQSLGHEAEARRVLIARERARYVHGGLSRTAKYWSIAEWLVLGYGYKPARALLWAFSFVLIGCAAVYEGKQAALFVPVADGVYRDSAYIRQLALPAGYPQLSPFIYSLDVFLPVVDLKQESSWRPAMATPCKLGAIEVGNCGTPLQMYMWLHALLGWTLTTLVIAGMTRLIRTR